MNKTLKNIIYVFLASTFSKILGAVATLIIPNILEPANYGVWATLLLIMSYSSIASLGTVEALFKQYPYLIGNGQLVKAREYEANVLGSIFMASIVLVLCAVLAPVVTAFVGLERYRMEIRLMLLAASVASFSGFFYFRLAANNQFRACGIVDASRAVVTLLFLSVFAWLWGLRGVVMGYLVVEILVCVMSMLLSVNISGKLRIQYNTSLILQAIKIGFPITIIWWTLTFQSSVDRLVSVSFLGKTTTGHYYLGVSLVGMLALIPGAVGRVLYPKINEGVGKNLSLDELSSLIILPVRTLCMVLPVLIGGLIIIAPSIYTILFPRYVPGLHSAQVLILGFFFSGLVGNGANYLIAINKQNILFMFVVISLAANAAFAVCFIYLGLSIEGVAMSTGLAVALLVTLIWRVVLKNMQYGVVGQLRGLLGLYAPFVVLLAILLICKMILPAFLDSTGIASVIYVFIFITFYLAIILLLPPYKKWGKEISALFKYHIVGTIKPAD